MTFTAEQEIALKKLVDEIIDQEKIKSKNAEIEIQLKTIDEEQQSEIDAVKTLDPASTTECKIEYVDPAEHKAIIEKYNALRAPLKTAKK